MENQHQSFLPCPYLPVPADRMSYHDLRAARDAGDAELFETAKRYSHYLWLQGRPARAILALLRAINIQPGTLKDPVKQPYSAFRWYLARDPHTGFLGNPRISFAHQATRISPDQAIQRARAWALWYLTRIQRPELGPDPKMIENPPDMDDLVIQLNAIGHRGEGDLFRQVAERGI